MPEAHDPLRRGQYHSIDGVCLPLVDVVILPRAIQQRADSGGPVPLPCLPLGLSGTASLDGLTA